MRALLLEAKNIKKSRNYTLFWNVLPGKVCLELFIGPLFAVNTSLTTLIVHHQWDTYIENKSHIESNLEK